MTAAARRAAAVATPHPLGRLLPALYQEDSFAQRFTDGLDAVLAPVLCVLDCLDAYVDPDVAPADFVAWLSSALGVEPDDTLPLDRKRAVLRGAARAYSLHGTKRGIAAAVRALADTDPIVLDSGGVSWSTDPYATPPEPRPPVVEVRLPATAGVHAGRVDRAISDAKPAHVAHVLTLFDDATDDEP